MCTQIQLFEELLADSTMTKEKETQPERTVLLGSGQTKAQTKLTNTLWRHEHGFRQNAIKPDNEIKQSILATSIYNVSGRWKHRRAESTLTTYSLT